MSMDMDVKGIEDCINFGQGLTSTMPVRFGKYLEQAALEVLDEARNNVQNNGSINTGALLASLRILSIDQDGLEITIGSDLPYAKYIEYGRGPVNTKTAKVLSWIDKDSGKRIFAKFAGPANPKPFFEPAVISKLRRYPEIAVENETAFIQELL